MKVTLVSFLIVLIFVISCSTNLESTRDYLIEGNKLKAEKTLLEHVKKTDVYALGEPEYNSGVDFMKLLEQMGSPELLQKVYDLKFSELSLEKNYFINSGYFSQEILRLSQKWQVGSLQQIIAEKIESEINILPKNEKYRENYLHFASFAALHLSQNKINHPNLSRYWEEIPHENYLEDFKSLWVYAKKTNAQSIFVVMKENLTLKIKSNSRQIIDLADPKEISFIKFAEEDIADSAHYTHFNQLIDKRLREDATEIRVARDELERLAPEIVEASDKLFDLNNEKNNLIQKNLYTFTVVVKCSDCASKGILTCPSCLGRRFCGQCDRGLVDCNRCFHRGFLTCGYCHGGGFCMERRKVWCDRRKCHIYEEFRVSCRSCRGFGRVDCGCDRGRMICGACRGNYACGTCRAEGIVDCPRCVGGEIVETHKTEQGNIIDEKIAGASTKYNALVNRQQFLNKLIQRNLERTKFLGLILEEK